MILVGICVDPMGCGGNSAEEEVAQHKVWLRKKFKGTKFSFYQAWHCGLGGKGLKPQTDLLLFDYGGMLPGNDLANSNARALIRWCQDNPSSLALVLSSFTYGSVIESELDELGLKELHNLVNWDETSEIPGWFVERLEGETGRNNG